MCTVYLCIYKYTHMHYIFKLYLYIKCIYTYYKLYEDKYMHVNKCTCFLNIYCMCVYIVNIKSTHTYIM